MSEQPATTTSTSQAPRGDPVGRRTVLRAAGVGGAGAGAAAALAACGGSRATRR